MWTRGWRTSLPRGSSQKHCRKPWVLRAPHLPSTPIPRIQQPPCKCCWAQCKRDAGESSTPRDITKGRAWGGGMGWQPWCAGCGHGACSTVGRQRGSTQGNCAGNGCPRQDTAISGGVSRVWIHPFGVGRVKKLIPCLLAAWSSPFPMLHLSPAPRLRRPAQDQPLWLPLGPAPSRRKLGIFLPSRNPNPAGARGVRRSPRVVPLPLGAGARCSVTFYEPPARQASQESL